MVQTVTPGRHRISRLIQRFRADATIARTLHADPNFRAGYADGAGGFPSLEDMYLTDPSQSRYARGFADGAWDALFGVVEDLGTEPAPTDPTPEPEPITEHIGSVEVDAFHPRYRGICECGWGGQWRYHAGSHTTLTAWDCSKFDAFEHVGLANARASAK